MSPSHPAPPRKPLPPGVEKPTLPVVESEKRRIIDGFSVFRQLRYWGFRFKKLAYNRQAHRKTPSIQFWIQPMGEPRITSV